MSNSKTSLQYGLLTGSLATLCASLAMCAFRKLQTQDDKHPAQKSSRSLKRLPIAGVPPTTKPVIPRLAARLGCGIAGGTAFAELWRTFGPKKWPVLHGMLFSLGLWFLGRKVRMPRMNGVPATLQPEPAGIVSHLVYGAVLGVDAGQIRIPDTD